MSDPAPDLSVTDARQGRRGRHVLIILVVSLALVVIGFVAVYGLNADKLSGGGGGQQTASKADAQMVDQTIEAPKQVETAPVSQ